MLSCFVLLNPVLTETIASTKEFKWDDVVKDQQRGNYLGT